jgi:hypothetical protein
VRSQIARKREPRYCLWCPRQVKGLLEVFRDGKWMPVCTTCYRARRNQVARTLTEVESGQGYAFRWKMGAVSHRSVRGTKAEPPALPLFPG